MKLINIGTLFTGSEFIHQTELEINSNISGEFDCQNQVVIPGLIDCHTHLVFAGSRVNEFELRAQGASYAEIMQAGGGIRNTMQATREASQEELIDLALPRLKKMLSLGVTSAEIKTGYGLSLDAELKMLAVIQKLQELQPISLSPTFLGAHAIPPEFTSHPDSYVEHVINDMLPAVREQNIAKSCDVFVEHGAFSVEQARKILTKAKELGLFIRVHADQLSHSGGSKLAAELKALSASHLEYISPEDALELSKAGVIAELLPIAQEFLGMKQLASGRMLRDAGVTVAVATDFNPGSSMCNDLILAARLAVTRGGLSCQEALTSITLNASKALGQNQLNPSDWCVLQLKNWVNLLYNWCENPIQTVFKNGHLVYSVL